MPEPAPLRVARVDDSGVHLTSAQDTVVDTLFDGRRIWSFWTLRDTRPGDAGQVAEWPPALRRFLDGTTQLSVVEHVSGRVLFDEEVSLGSSTDRIAVVDSLRAASRHRQVQPDHHDLRHPRPRPDGSVAGLDRAGALGAARGRGGCVPGVRHPARRHPRTGLHRPRQRCRPRLRQPAQAPSRRDPGVLPAAAQPARTWVLHRPLQRGCLQGRGARGRRCRPWARRVRRLLPQRAPLPDGGDRHAVRGGLGVPARDVHLRRPDVAGPGHGRRSCWRRRTGRTGRCPTRPSTSPPRARRTAGSTAGSVGRGSTARSGTGATASCGRSCPRGVRARWRGTCSRRRARWRGSSTSVPDVEPTRCGSPARACRPSPSTTRAAQRTRFSARRRRKASTSRSAG